MRPLCACYHLTNENREVVAFDYGIKWYLVPRELFEKLHFGSRNVLKQIRKYEVSFIVLELLGM